MRAKGHRAIITATQNTHMYPNRGGQRARGNGERREENVLELRPGGSQPRGAALERRRPAVRLARLLAFEAATELGQLLEGEAEVFLEQVLIRGVLLQDGAPSFVPSEHHI